MKTLPFTQDNFQLYSVDEVCALFKNEFELLNSCTQVEEVKSKAGDLVLRTFHTLSFKPKV
ncbi:hypothetical protein BIY24_03320 [Halobacteriovorax marinus]|nr:hypothetical protein [Halobacteriovorax marinus]ATH06998.1 hypothetical protein BIY24_03320 [Halobacteriovorax marinus]